MVRDALAKNKILTTFVLQIGPLLASPEISRPFAMNLDSS